MIDSSRLIRLFLVDGKPDGIKTMEISNMTIKATMFPRPFLKDFSKREEAQKPGVYLLYSEPDDDSGKPMLYIGEGDPVLQRLQTHGIKKEFWTQSFVFTSKDGYLTKTQIQYLEARLISLAKEAGRVTLDNVQASTEPTISEVDRSEVRQFLESITVLLSTMRIKFFEPLARTPIKEDSGIEQTVYEFKIKKCHGRMTIKDGEYIVLCGSLANAEHLPSAHKAIRKLRDELIADGALKAIGDDLLEVVKDIPCTSSSYAAAIISGGNQNGMICWKYNGKSLKDIEAEEAK